MTHYIATVAHHSISRGRFIKFQAATVAAAKRRAYNEFKGDFTDYVIELTVDSEHHRNPCGRWTRRVGDTRRAPWFNWYPAHKVGA